LKAKLELRFETDGHRSRMRVGAQEPPWRVIRAFSQPNGACLAHLHNVSGGILAGDRLALDVQVCPRAVAQLTSTGATRLYRHRAGGADSTQEISITVGENGLLEYLPDMLIPFRGSRHHQQTLVILEKGATFLSWEMVAPGRHAMGEQFAFDRLQISTRVQSADGPLLLEDFLVEPDRRSPSAPARLGGFTHSAAFYAFQCGRSPADLRALECRLGEIAREASQAGCTIWGASALGAGGIAVRGLSATSRRLPATLVRFWDAARRFLTGEEAVPPRKLK
jgi:urease accessory protein